MGNRLLLCMGIPNIPGIEKYPHLQKQLANEYSSIGGANCKKCQLSRLARKYKAKVIHLQRKESHKVR